MDDKYITYIYKFVSGKCLLTTEEKHELIMSLTKSSLSSRRHSEIKFFMDCINFITTEN
jgi:hypothetical protein